MKNTYRSMIPWAASAGITAMIIGAAIFNHVPTKAVARLPLSPPSTVLSMPTKNYDDSLTAQEWTAWAAIAAVGVSLLSLSIIFWTLITTRQMLLETRETVRLTRDTVKHSEQTVHAHILQSEAHLRAYLSYGDPSFSYLNEVRKDYREEPNENDYGIRLSIDLTNVGHGAARYFRLRGYEITITPKVADCAPPVRIIQAEDAKPLIAHLGMISGKDTRTANFDISAIDKSNDDQLPDFMGKDNLKRIFNCDHYTIEASGAFSYVDILGYTIIDVFEFKTSIKRSGRPCDPISGEGDCSQIYYKFRNPILLRSDIPHKKIADIIAEYPENGAVGLIANNPKS